MDNSSRFSRRAALLAAGGLALATGALGGTAGSAYAAGRRRTPAPETITLPDGFRPEGITASATALFVGSLADGRIVRVDPVTGAVTTVWAGQAGRQVRGLRHDPRSGLIWAAGNVGSAAHVWAIDSNTGAVVFDQLVSGGVFLNDLVVTRDAVFVTDSRVDRLTRIPLTTAGTPTGAAPTFIPLGGAWPAGDGTAVNANGIRELPDGSLILNNSQHGGLWQVDPVTGVAREIPVSGGPGITGGDGLELSGEWLYNVRGSGQYEVSVLKLSPDGSGGWRAKWQGARSDETLDIPSTAALLGGWLWAVNARFGVASPNTASYWITRLPAR
ncbi:hypothetical protein CGZ95_08550 [Enemella evansiae]|uniref:hypothetical protein n=1 Tax=Enemella evansiae TaxID=2016499 RepID=UPI000B961DF9|nr:hypothetical protein [Enemella evansiae]OYO00669.1 hypothetical protein CGZ95_08550 [Enemella evansiae]